MSGWTYAVFRGGLDAPRAPTQAFSRPATHSNQALRTAIPDRKKRKLPQKKGEETLCLAQSRCFS